MHMLSRKDQNSAELETARVSKNPTAVVTANGEVQTKGEATAYVKELDLFVTVKLLEDTPAILTWKTFRRSRIFLLVDQWSETKETTTHEIWQTKTMQHGKLRAYRFTRIVSQTFQLVYEYNLNIGIPASLPQEAVIPTLRQASTRSESTSCRAWGDLSARTKHHRWQPHNSWTLFQDYQDAQSISLHSSQNGRCTVIIGNSKVGMSRYLDTSTKTQMADVMVQYGRPSRSSWTKTVRSPSSRTIMGKTIWEKFCWNTVGKKF